MRFSILLLALIAFGYSQSFYENGEEVFITPLSQTRSLQASAHPSAPTTDVVWYQRANGTTLGVLPQILVTWAEDNQKETIIAEFKPLSVDQISPTISLLHFSVGTDVFTLSKKLYQLPSISSAHPNFIKEKQLR